MISDLLRDSAARSEAVTAAGAGVAIAFLCNLVNNLPAGLIAGSAVQGAHVSERVTSAILVGVDLGPNLSVTGSLATILWLSALKREGVSVSSWRFLKLGVLVMPPALLLALAALFIV
jgi:arsenical pump membrane protein